MISRRLHRQIAEGLRKFPVVALLGPRQVGKTTLAKALAKEHGTPALYLDLERPSDAAKLADAELYLARHEQALVILDEVQRVPELFPVLRSLVDAKRVPGRFLVLGSASPELLRQSSETLAGRIQYCELAPFSLDEVGHDMESLRRLWLRGGYPESYLAADDESSFQWREAFVRSFLERDLPNLGLSLPLALLRRFWQMLAHRHGQLWNASALAAGLGISPPTAGRYLDLLCNTFMARRLQPYHANLEKRLVKSPKVYLRDSGLLHSLHGVADFESLQGHPIIGTSWEGFLVEQVLATHGRSEAWFYRTSAGAEIDLLLSGPRNRSRPAAAIEMKYSLQPKPARGFWSALEDLRATKAYVLYPGTERYPLAKGVEALPAISLGDSLDMTA